MEENRPNILAVDDNPRNLQVLGATLETTGFDLAFLTDGKAVVPWARAHLPTLILLDIMMPDIDGFDLCRALKADLITHEIPVIFVTARTEPEAVIRGFEAGAVDYVTKPFNIPELLARVRTHVELRQARLELEDYVRQLSMANSKLSIMMRRMEELATTDELTGLENRRSFLQRFQDEETRAKRSGRRFCVAIIDIDFFKRVNDNYGHECGDYALKTACDGIRASIRGQDSIARWGGEEFTLLLPETPLSGALEVAERIRTRIADTPIIYGKDILNLTVTIGVTEYDEDEGIDGSIKKADDALYRGKRDGRNRVVTG